MTKFQDKIMVVLLLGSIWGAFEVFGFRWLSELGVPHKSPFLFAFAILTMSAAKRIAPVPGSALVMAGIAVFYKTLTFSLPACGSNAVIAVILDGGAFELVYWLGRKHLEAGVVQRSLISLVITALAFGAFALYADFLNPEATAKSPSFTGTLRYLESSGLYAGAFGIVAINLGFLVGNSFQAMLMTTGSRGFMRVHRITGGLCIIGLWSLRLW